MSTKDTESTQESADPTTESATDASATTEPANAGASDQIVVESDDVTVEKEPTNHTQGIYQIAFRIQSRASEPIRVRIRDRHADGQGEVGFHPDYDPENWESAENGDVVYERTLPADGSYETMYGFRTDASEPVDWVSRPPAVEVDGATEDREPDSEEADLEAAAAERQPTESGDTETGSRSAQDSAKPDGGELPSEQEGTTEAGSDGETAQDASDVTRAAEREAEGWSDHAGAVAPESREIRTADTARKDPPLDNERGFGSRESGEAGIGTGSAESEPGNDESPVAALVEELRSRELTAEEQSVLEDALDLDRPASMQVRLSHLREQVDDLLAYRDALECFINETGGGTQIVEDLQAEIDGTETRLQTLEIEVTEGFEEFETRLDAHDERLENAENRLETLADLEDALTSLQTDCERLESSLETLEDSQAANFEEIESRLESVRTAMAETNESFESELAAVRETVEAGREWREQLSASIDRAPGKES